MAERKKKKRNTRNVKSADQYFDYSMLAVLIFLICFGLVMLFSTSSYSALIKQGDSMMNSDIQKLRTILMVSKTLNFSEAAYELNFTPSAISKQVLSIEKSLGVNLFDRHSRNGVTLTPEMQMLLLALQKVVSSFDEFEGVLRTISLEPVFNIGTPPLFPSQIASQIIAEMVQQMPLLKLVRLGKIDAAVTVILGKAEDNPEFFEERHSELEIKKLRKTQDMVFLNENHPLASRNTFSTKDMLEVEGSRFLFINPRPHTASHREQIFMRYCEKYGVVREVKEVNLESSVAIRTILRNISSNPQYIAFGPAGLSKGVKGVVERVCEDSMYPSQEVICYRKDSKSKAFRIFLDAVKKVADGEL